MQLVGGATLSSRNSAVRIVDMKGVVTKINYSVHGGNVKCHGRTFAASVGSEASEPFRRQRRLSKDERRAMVISFIDKYRSENSGRFPPPSIARKNLGGSYYVIKQIIQELEYKCKTPTTNRIEEKIQRKEVEAATPESLTEVEELCESMMGFTPEHKWEVDAGAQTMINRTDDGVISKHFNAKGPQISTKNKEVLTVENIKLESKESIRSHDDKHEDCEKEGTAVKGFGESSPKEEVAQDTAQARYSDNFERNIVRMDNEEDELQKRSTIWENLKSITDGFLNFWRKK